MSSSARDWFLDALEKPPADRERLLDRLRQDDPSLHDKVARLLEAHQDTGPLDVSRHEPPQSEGPQPPVPMASLPAGTVLEDYEILSEIASGGAGVVYRARQLSLNRIVALKFLRVGEFATEREVDRFRAEAEAAARLDHPNIVPVFEVGQLEGRHYFSMKLVEGPSLSEEFRRMRDDPRAAVRLLVKVARAVHHAHQRSLLHRDIKPSNILLDERGTPFVADFGIAKRIDPGEGVTETGWALGTPAYMAPEQVMPAVGEVTVQTDVYALGCLLFEALAGHPPFRGRTVSEVFRKIMKEEPPALSEPQQPVPRDLETIVRKCLSKEPEMRFASALQVADDLERWLSHQPIRARQATPLERLWLVWRRKPVATSLAAAVVLLVIVLALGASVASLLLRQNLERARTAEQEATQRLRSSLVAQARANRHSGVPGQRLGSLELLGLAADIEPGYDLVDEAVASLVLTDLDVAQEWPVESSDPISTILIDRRGLYAAGIRGGRVELRRTSDNHIDGFLPGFGIDPWHMAVSEDHRYLAVKYHDPRNVEQTASMRVWDLETRQTVFDFGRLVSNRAMAFDPQSGLLLTGDSEHTLQWWDFLEGRLMREMPLKDHPTAIALHPSEPYLALALGHGNILQIRDRSDGRLVHELELPGVIYSMDWSVDGRLLAVGGGFDLFVIENGTWQEMLRLKGHDSEIVEVYFSPDAPLIVTYAWDETTRLWHGITGQQLLMASVRAKGFSRDGQQLAFRSNDTVGLWNVLHGDTFRTLYAHQGKNPTRTAFSADGRWMASAGRDQLLLWEWGNHWPLRILSGQATGGIFFHPADRHLYACTKGGILRWPMPEEGPPAADLAPQVVLDKPCHRFTSGENGRLLAYYNNPEPDVVLLELPAAGRGAQGETGRAGAGDVRVLRRMQAIAKLDSLSLSPDGSLLAAGNWTGDRVQIWNTEDGSQRAVLCRGMNAVRVRFSPDGKLLMTGSNISYQAWDTQTWKEIYSIPRPLRVSNVAGLIEFDRMRNIMAITSSVRRIQLTDPRTGTALITLEAPDTHIFEGLDFAPSGEFLARASGTNRIQIWNLESIRAQLRQLNLSSRPATPEALPETSPATSDKPQARSPNGNASPRMLQAQAPDLQERK